MAELLDLTDEEIAQLEVAARAPLPPPKADPARALLDSADFGPQVYEDME
jgi:hypothetical protein